MNKKILIIFGIIVLILAGTWVLSSREEVRKTVLPSPTSSPAGRAFETRINEQGEVTVEVTPKNLTESESTFQVTFNTHSVELDTDLTKASKLTDNQGNTYQPLSWDGGSGGHHLSGTLTFPAVSRSAKSIELTISQIGGVERKFQWNL